MSAPTSFKRRRLNESIDKPFRSPLRPTSSLANASAATPSSPLATTQQTPIKPRLTTTPNPPLAQTNPPPSALRQRRTLAADSTSIPPHLAQHTKSLDRAILQTRQDIDTLRQALSILRADRSAQLAALTDKWRSAARLAAEEVFAGARDRVNRMGGVGAWREAERERVERREGGFGDEEREDEDEHGRGDERRWEAESEEAQWREERRRKKDEEERMYGGAEGLTMDMMLTTLGIGLEVVGYSRERQMWVG